MNNENNNKKYSIGPNSYLLKQLATVFVRLELNFKSDLKNFSKISLSTDCLMPVSQTFLFSIVSCKLEAQILCLLDASLDTIVSAKQAFVYLEYIIADSLDNFIGFYLPKKKIDCLSYDFSIDFSLCDLIIWNHLLNYFMTGNFRPFYIQQSVILSPKLLEEHILALLSHFVIKISNTIIKFLLSHDEKVLVRQLFYKVCNIPFLSTRYLINLKNNLLLFRAIDFYIYEPKFIYENRYLLCYIKSNAICSKKIYSDRKTELSILSPPQLFLVLLLELQDLFFPKLQQLVYLLGKSIIYVFSYFIGTVVRLILDKFSK
nr:Ycf55 [Porphyropsis coccinea]